MSDATLKELIQLVPTAIWASVILTVAFMFRSAIRDRVLPRVTKFSAFGVEIQASVKEELDRAAEVAPSGGEFERQQTARRAARVGSVVMGARLLLVNDIPAEMRTPISIFRSLGIAVDVETSTGKALSRLGAKGYDVVISDMRRGSDHSAGTTLLREMRNRNHLQPVIFTVGRYEPERGVPAYAFGITNRIDEMIHLVFDALERTRG
ncbi:response regulator [Streptomyces barringtoniae]|uniref:response regulator n=1 Tax=Streptomyces barringtoniae TaxID=2892029 RepID=UPI001E2C3FE7|nr:response regulator [Streptomyces barringtoniae]MCC5479028.1 response regulator [Streptomyces barringtoniae]